MIKWWLEKRGKEIDEMSDEEFAQWEAKMDRRIKMLKIAVPFVIVAVLAFSIWRAVQCGETGGEHWYCWLR
jgi:hypothetical protein